MRITVVRSGGILGVPRRWDILVEEQSDPDAWRTLLQTLPWDQAERTAPVPDRFVYRIECDPHRVVLPEQDVVGPWRELVDRVSGTADGTATAERG